MSYTRKRYPPLLVKGRLALRDALDWVPSNRAMARHYALKAARLAGLAGDLSAARRALALAHKLETED